MGKQRERINKMKGLAENEWKMNKKLDVKQL